MATRTGRSSGAWCEAVKIPVYGNGDCIEAADLLKRQRESGVAGVLVGRGVLRNPWIFAQAHALARGLAPPVVTLEDRGRFLLEYIDLLLNEGVNEPAGFRHVAACRCGAGLPALCELGRRPASPGLRQSLAKAARLPAARGRERWVINKIRALCAWYTRGLEGGARLRVTVNQTNSIPALRQTIAEFFLD